MGKSRKTSQPGGTEVSQGDKKALSTGNSGVEHSSRDPVEGRAGELTEQM